MSNLFRLPPPPLLSPHYCRSSSWPPTPPCLHNLTSPSSSAFPDLHFQQTVAGIRSFKRLPFNTVVVTCSAASDALLSGFPEEAWPPQSLSEPALNRPPASSRKRQEKKRKLIADVDQSELVDPWLLADPDSRFAEYFGVQVHYKIAHPSTEESAAEAFSATEASEVNGSSVSSSKLVEDRSVEPSLQMRIGMPLICLHGFGASVYSWQKVLQPLANRLGSRVVAFDRPAFGLTSRLHPQKSNFRGKEKIFPNPYSLGFSTMLSLAFIEFLKADKAILIGCERFWMNFSYGGVKMTHGEAIMENLVLHCSYCTSTELSTLFEHIFMHVTCLGLY
ncbi:hypothetical protein O6H91_15G007100 [Diphasiastrum complanatum]|uniref:Uncharacterized protein n=1 Tax=Diphasiastrum complanatum TaxID=34168 RepID=A0ACC2BFP5_DIPCM|nr:hypothetical protein O6H91_15G007100 [Diphasiastrum complanatum]